MNEPARKIKTVDEVREEFEAVAPEVFSEYDFEESTYGVLISRKGDNKSTTILTVGDRYEIHPVKDGKDFKELFGAGITGGLMDLRKAIMIAEVVEYMPLNSLRLFVNENRDEFGYR